MAVGCVIRVVLSGVESVGKSRLADALALELGGLVVAEYGRQYTEGLTCELTLADHLAIADGHARAADDAAKALAENARAGTPGLLIEDTDVVMTCAWATMLFGGRDPALAMRASRADLHLLLLPDVPFVADPVRMFGENADRLRFHSIVVAEFAARGLGFVPIGGDWKARHARAVAAIRERTG